MCTDGLPGNIMTVYAEVVDYPLLHGLNPASPERLDYSVKAEDRGFFGGKLNLVERRSAGIFPISYRGLWMSAKAA